MTTSSTVCLSGEVDSVEHLLDDGGTLTTTQHRLIVEVDEKAFFDSACEWPALDVEERCPDWLVKCVQQPDDGRRRSRH